MRRAILAGVAAAALAVPRAAGAEGKACDLVTSAELQASLGAPVTWGSGGRMPSGVEVCTGKSGAAEVMVRLFKRSDDPSGDREKAGIELLRKMGAKVEVQRFGPITCVAAAPGGKMVGHPFTTSCSVSKAPMFAVIEVRNGERAVPIDRLRPVAEKLMKRF
jgi:hypothetical protein